MLRHIDFDLNPWRLLDDWMDSGMRPGSVLDTELSSRFPRVNVWEGDASMVFDAELPGVDPKAVDVSVEGDELTLSGVVGAEGESTDAPRFERRFELPFEIDADKVEAVYSRGILRINLPKAETSRRRRIAINT